MTFYYIFLAGVKTTFMECRKVEDGKAPIIMDRTKTTTWNFGVQIGKVDGLWTDGAAVIASDL